MKKKEGLKIVVVGHVDHGKSTVIGRLLFDTNSLPEGTIDKVKKIAKDTGKPFEYAYLLDAFEEEQKQGITIDTTQIQFFTNVRDYVIIDAPGHIEFLKNMISGAANANAALLVIDAKQGVQEQSRRHGYMLSLLGIKKVYVLINKMDLVDYDEEVFEKVAKEMDDFLAPLGVRPLGYIPVSGLAGENISSTSSLMDWYKGQCVLDAMDALEGDKDIDKKDLRLPIQDVYKFDDRRIIAGRIEAGTIHTGDEIVIYPSGKTTVVESIAYWAESDKKNAAVAGVSTGITVRDEFFNKRGEVIGLKGEVPPHITNCFRASVFWMGKDAFTTKKKYRIKLATQEVEAELESIEKVINAAELGSTEGAKEVRLNDVAEVIIRTKDLLTFDLFQDNQSTGRFVIVDGYDVVGGGIVINSEIESAEKFNPTFVGNGLEARGDIFDEFYYDVKTMEVVKVAEHKNTYTIGDMVPLQGDSYAYPKTLSVVVLRDGVVIKIVDGKLADILSLSAYVYHNEPLVNGRGFGIAIGNEEDFSTFIEAYRHTDFNDAKVAAEFSNTYFEFAKYRTLSFYFDYVI